MIIIQLPPGSEGFFFVALSIIKLPNLVLHCHVIQLSYFSL